MPETMTAPAPEHPSTQSTGWDKLNTNGRIDHAKFGAWTDSPDSNQLDSGDTDKNGEHPVGEAPRTAEVVKGEGDAALELGGVESPDATTGPEAQAKLDEINAREDALRATARQKGGLSLDERKQMDDLRAQRDSLNGRLKEIDAEARDNGWEEPDVRPYDARFADFDEGDDALVQDEITKEAQPSNPNVKGNDQAQETQTNETQPSDPNVEGSSQTPETPKKSPREKALDAFENSMYQSLLDDKEAPITESEARARAAQAREALANSRLGDAKTAEASEPTADTASATLDLPTPEPGAPAEEIEPPTAESQNTAPETDETGEDFQETPDLKYEDVKDFSERQLKNHVDSILEEAKSKGDHANRIANLNKLGEQVKDVHKKLQEDREAAQAEYKEQKGRVKYMEDEDPTSRYLLEEQRMLKEMGDKVKELDSKDKFLGKASDMVEGAILYTRLRQSWELAKKDGETEQQVRAKAGEIGAAATSGQEARQAQRADAWKNMSYADIYKHVLEGKTAGRTRIIGPLNRLTARWEANKIAKDAAKSGEHSDEGSLLVGNRAARATSRKAAEHQIRDDKTEQRVDTRRREAERKVAERRSNAAGRAAERFARFS